MELYNYKGSKKILTNLGSTSIDIPPPSNDDGDEDNKENKPMFEATMKGWCDYIADKYPDIWHFLKGNKPDTSSDIILDFDDALIKFNWKDVKNITKFLDFYYLHSKYSRAIKGTGNFIKLFTSEDYPNHILGENNIRKHVAEEENVNFHEVTIYFAYLGFGLQDKDFIDNCKDFKRGKNLNNAAKENFLVSKYQSFKTLKEINSLNYYTDGMIKVLYKISK